MFDIGDSFLCEFSFNIYIHLNPGGKILFLKIIPILKQDKPMSMIIQYLKAP